MMELMLRPKGCQFKRRDPLPLQPNCLWRIESGYVRSLSWNEDGHVTTLGIWGVGDVVGKPFTLLKCYQLECLTAVRAALLPPDSQCLEAVYRQHLQQTEVLFNLMHERTIAARLLKALHFLCFRFGRLTDQGWVLDVPLTHQTLAELIGTTRVTVTRSLADFNRSGELYLLKQHRILFPEFAPKQNMRELEFNPSK